MLGADKTQRPPPQNPASPRRHHSTLTRFSNSRGISLERWREKREWSKTASEGMLSRLARRGEGRREPTPVEEVE